MSGRLVHFEIGCRDTSEQRASRHHRIARQAIPTQTPRVTGLTIACC